MNKEVEDKYYLLVEVDVNYDLDARNGEENTVADQMVVDPWLLTLGEHQANKIEIRDVARLSTRENNLPTLCRALVWL